MALYLGILIFAFIITSIAIIPFIDLLYRLHFTHTKPLPASSVFEARAVTRLHHRHKWKLGTPIGGGIIIIFLVTLVYSFLLPVMGKLGVYITSVFPKKQELNIIFFTFIAFGLLGLFDDIIKIFNLKKKGFLGLGVSHKAILQVVLAVIVAAMLYLNLSINVLNIPYIGVIRFGWWYIPVATGIILLFTRAFDIADGLDGLANGVLLISLTALWAISFSMLDTLLSAFIALWIGSLVAFMYFNVYPARIWLGNAGSLSFGATLAVTGLLLGKTVGLLVIGGIFVIEIVTHYAQYFSTRLFRRRIFKITPLHYLLLDYGWPEPKIVMRAWLVSIFLALFGLWLAGV
ncbi:MAG: Phospho-N-acetylmuramoyl-pentapeptide-transferase [Candidatus Amesbacteria bacterium GW2011_GWB1_47_19]|nr:MAG: Phospho-N-acetylmuramoyl-pentapeptide-transferase [Candidatus Amesbacteria bacterium GW2011_GWA1_44_24]KKU30946.1 MAG: hypothetical protein UX46_C0009G0022 [Candidatus Amesbacteria bacterium GW2011_GWC1_46_24]KKU66609.1 MAG: Phospho-N-acetylmuramoyl-pentapeptide-transferase [Candidatus Amesbacteria bacterium GW2011_GWB1_47_19]OGD05329.1 MAG: hypothetical protein A2379_01235 [Candidatus Amesbacteria bacterium RIFOXYB1_FULL_47_13]HBC73216.1 hypothetical protein [Candidatus Amesbacteria ba